MGGDAAGRVRVAAAALLVGAFALAAVLLSATTAVVVVAVLAFAAGLMAYPPVMQAALMDAFPDASMGSDLGGMRTVYIGPGSARPPSGPSPTWPASCRPSRRSWGVCWWRAG